VFVDIFSLAVFLNKFPVLWFHWIWNALQRPDTFAIPFLCYLVLLSISATTWKESYRIVSHAAVFRFRHIQPKTFLACLDFRRPYLSSMTYYRCGWLVQTLPLLWRWQWEPWRRFQYQFGAYLVLVAESLCITGQLELSKFCSRF